MRGSIELPHILSEFSLTTSTRRTPFKSVIFGLMRFRPASARIVQ